MICLLPFEYFSGYLDSSLFLIDLMRLKIKSKSCFIEFKMDM